MSETTPEPAAKQPPPVKIGLAFVYLVGLTWLFYKSWETVVWYTWFRFDPASDGANLGTFDRTKAWIATGFVWVILVATAARFVINLFSSGRGYAVLVRQAFAAVVMLVVGRWICGFSIVMGLHLWPLWDTSYKWLPDYSLIPLVGAITLFVLGTVGFDDFWGFPLKKFIPQPFKELASRLIANSFKPSDIPFPKGPKQSATTAGYANLLWLQALRTLVLVYLMPLLFGACLAVVGLAFGFAGARNWQASGMGIHAFSILVLLFLFFPTLRKLSGWLRTGMWLVGIVGGLALFLSILDEKDFSSDAKSVCNVILLALPMIVSLIASIRVSQAISRDTWGAENDTRFVGIGLNVPDAFNIYCSMFIRMLRPYFIALAMFVGITYVAVRFEVSLLILAWPLAFFLHRAVFSRTVWYEAHPYHYKDSGSANDGTPDFVNPDASDS